ncbi:MAG: roadblock/LC7 domain-containing protein [Candidatus Ranarchaeia archaeon]
MSESGPRETLKKFLEELIKSVPQIESVAVVSIEGLPIVSILPKTIDEMRVSAMTAAMLSMGENASTELGKGTLQEILVAGGSGYIITLAAGPNAVITAAAKKDVELGYIYIYLKRIAKKIESSL